MKLILLSLTAVVMFCCTTKTEVYESQMNKELVNGQILMVKKTDEISRSYGAISGHLWNESHQYKYNITIKPNEIEWTGLLGETPRFIVLCQDELFLKTTTEHVVSDTIKHITYTVSNPAYYRHVDKRYFFKLFGEQYFVTIDSAEYQTRNAKCSEENVPTM